MWGPGRFKEAVGPFYKIETFKTQENTQHCQSDFMPYRVSVHEEEFSFAHVRTSERLLRVTDHFSTWRKEGRKHTRGLPKDVKLAGSSGLARTAASRSVLTQRPRGVQGCPSLAPKTRDPWLACMSLQLV